MGVKARGVEGFDRVGQMNKKNFSLFHRVLPLMGLLSKKPAKLDLFSQWYFFFALEMGERWVIFGPRIGAGRRNQKILEMTDIRCSPVYP